MNVTIYFYLRKLRKRLCCLQHLSGLRSCTKTRGQVYMAVERALTKASEFRVKGLSLGREGQYQRLHVLSYEGGT